MKPAPFRYRRPETEAEAVDTLAAHSGAKVLAGGQSLVPLLSMRLAAPEMLVDITALDDLDRVEVSEDGVRVGALARHARVLADERALAVTVAVRKLRPPVPHHLDTCGVRIRRTRADLG